MVALEPARVVMSVACSQGRWTHTHYLTRNGDLHMQTKVASVDSCELPLSLI